MHDQDMVPAWIDGRLTPVEKLAVHQRGLRHMAVSVFVMREGRLLIQQRAMSKYHTPGLWANTCCTHPRWAEAGDDCARRRLAEELGITGLDVLDMGEVEYRADVGNGLTEHEVVRMFRADPSVDLTITLNPDEVLQTRWISRADLLAEVAARPEHFTPWLRIYLQEHAARIFG